MGQKRPLLRYNLGLIAALREWEKGAEAVISDVKAQRIGPYGSTVVAKGMYS
jgi:hypothetical protein